MEPIHHRKELPKDYHCTCKYCSGFYKGEIIQPDGKHYSARRRQGYSQLEKENKHIAPGHWHGYAFVIENFSKEGQMVFDPFAGSGTCLVEAAKRDRKAIGVELEFGDITEANIAPYSDTMVFRGDSSEMIKEIDFKFDLIVTGPPYNNHSDPPERKNLKTREDKSFDYQETGSFAFFKDKEYYEEMTKLFSKIYKKTKKGGHFALIVKDPIRQKDSYLLHKYLTDCATEAGYSIDSVYIHKHNPATMFMNTYTKRFPEVKLPFYQTITILKK